MKIAFIGAGSLGFTRTLLTDILTVPALRNIEVSFMDINRRNLDMVTMLCQRDVDENKLNIKIHATTDRRAAMRDANYIITCFRVGGLEAFEQDIEIPLKYGVDQCVGDTLCAGGIMYGQRGIAAILDVCKDIREVAAPDAMILNYANPNAMITWAANKYGEVKTIGLCHGVMDGLHPISMALGREPDQYRDREDFKVICAGINHQTWYISVKLKGEDVTDKLLSGFEKHEWLSKSEKVRIDILRRFGFFSTETNGHLSEYLAWYRKSPIDLENWINLDYWCLGETGGYLRVAKNSRNWFETEFPAMMAATPRNYDTVKRSIEHGSYIIEGLESGTVYRGHFNVMNNGCITNLPSECVVEVPGYVDFNGISIPQVGDLPLGCAAICSQTAWVQRLAVEAAVAGDINLLRQAMMMDPLTGAVCTPPEIDQMVDEMLVAGEKWLPQYAKAIVDAKKRLNGDLLPTRDYKGIRLTGSTKMELQEKEVRE